jgi:hypothetical protein
MGRYLGWIAYCMALVCACYSETAFAAQEDSIKGNLASLPV